MNGKRKSKADTQLSADTFQELKLQMQQAVVELGNPDMSSVIYRGQTNANWGLQCSLIRKGLEWLGADFPEHLPTMESDIFYHFLTRMSRTLPSDRSGWDYLYHMQHYDLPTRLLDWSISAAHALWFAAKAQPIKSAGPESAVDKPFACLWVLNACELNQHSWGYADLLDPEYLLEDDYTYKDYMANSRAFQFKSPVAVTPIPVNDRMVAQRGYFTIFGTCLAPLDEQVPKCVRKIVLSERCAEEVREMLEFFDFNEYSMRPDVTGLERYLREMYEGGARKSVGSQVMARKTS